MKIGILGGGQLCRMLALAGYPFGFTFKFYDSSPSACAGQVGPLTVGAFDDTEALKAFAKDLDVVTFEFENITPVAVQCCAAITKVFPSLQSLTTGQDRIKEKTFFKSLEIPTARFFEVRSKESLVIAVKELGFPVVLKTTTLGYDGKGQKVLRNDKDIEEGWKLLGTHTLIVEEFISFDRELSIIAARGQDGAIVFYPLVQNTHHEGILRTTRAPAPEWTAALQAKAEKYISRIVSTLEYVGVCALELFQKGDELIANEMAPRVHNTGHWTMDGAVTSQFENHIRAIAGLPLGSTRVRAHTTMLNLIGTIPPLEAVTTLQSVHTHLYGKDIRPGRKVGHINICDKHSELERILEGLISKQGPGPH